MRDYRPTICMTPEEEGRFWSFVVPNPDTSCWEWLGCKSIGGYGRFQARGLNRTAHRVWYEHDRGPIGVNTTLDHLCRNKGCVNPAHLEPVSIGENIRRAKSLKTVCSKGHPLEMVSDGCKKKQRYCKVCGAKASLAWYHRNRSVKALVVLGIRI